MRKLAGLYRCTSGMILFAGLTMSIGPDGKVTMNRSGFSERYFMNGKITYFSPAGFVVKFNSMKGPLDSKFVFQRGYPRSFFNNDNGVISAFTRM